MEDRIAADADVGTLAPALLGATHLLFAARDSPPPAPEAVRKVVSTVIASVLLGLRSLGYCLSIVEGA